VGVDSGADDGNGEGGSGGCEAGGFGQVQPAGPGGCGGEITRARGFAPEGQSPLLAAARRRRSKHVSCCCNLQPRRLSILKALQAALLQSRAHESLMLASFFQSMRGHKFALRFSVRFPAPSVVSGISLKADQILDSWSS